MKKSSSAPTESPTVTRILSDNRIVELVYNPSSQRTDLAVWNGKHCKIVQSLDLKAGERLIPVPATNNLLRHQAVLLPERPEPYGSAEQLVANIEQYLDRYVTLSDEFRSIAAYYILFTWVHDRFDELPYLRLQADYGSGKTRALIVIGSICYRAFFAGGASTVSPLFHTLNTFGGTLILDEADFRYSDQTAELVKILNNGNVKGFPVFRAVMNSQKTFDPQAFRVFGPKIVAMRRSFDDDALESRFITERLDQVRMAPHVPINLPEAQREEALILRNKLLQYRFEHRLGESLSAQSVDHTLSPRTNQVLLPLLSVIPTEAGREHVRETMQTLEHERVTARSTTAEADVVAALAEICANGGASSILVADIADKLRERFGMDYDRPISNKYVGSILRTRLGFQTYKSSGVYRVFVKKERVSLLCIRYGILHTTLPDINIEK